MCGMLSDYPLMCFRWLLFVGGNWPRRVKRPMVQSGDLPPTPPTPAATGVHRLYQTQCSCGDVALRNVYATRHWVCCTVLTLNVIHVLHHQNSQVKRCHVHQSVQQPINFDLRVIFALQARFTGSTGTARQTHLHQPGSSSSRQWRRRAGGHGPVRRPRQAKAHNPAPR